MEPDTDGEDSTPSEQCPNDHDCDDEKVDGESEPWV